MSDVKRERFVNTLTSAYKQEDYVLFLKELLVNMQIVAPNKDIKPWNTFSAAVDHYNHIGNYVGDDGKKVALFSVCLRNDKNIENARSMQRGFVKSLLESSDCAGALVSFFTTEEPEKWRLSLVRMDYEFSKGKISAKLTPAKRYSYLVGEKEPSHTAQERLYPIFIDDNRNPGLDELEDAFSVEAVTNDFFDQYKEKFLQLKESLDNNSQFVKEADSRGFSSEQFAKKLMGQIVFLYFIQKKGWLGVNAFPAKLTEREYKSAFYKSGQKPKELMPKAYKPIGDGMYSRDGKAIVSLSDDDQTILSTLVKGDPWGEGPKDFMRQIFNSAEEHGSNYFDDYLEPLFYTGLNQNRGENAYFPPFHRRIPFLNGGLFEQMEGYDWENNDFSIPNSLFSNVSEKGRDADGILDVFDRYNFTMAEDEPMEREVAIDPEMLGKVFENLLDVSDRKSKGAFYTPREIVHYMCQESIIDYLSKKTQIEESDIRKLVVYGEYYRDEDTKKTLPVDNETGEVLTGDEIYIRKHHMEFDKSKEMEIPSSIFSYKDGVNRLGEIDDLLACVRVVDLAVGSGAFPLGMLNEIVRVRDTITSYQVIEMNGYQRLGYRSSRNMYNLKRNTIKNCIYACDIEASAADITKLRLWLSLVIDNQIMTEVNEELGYSTKPRELPNLDCNVICGNSLVDEFQGITFETESSALNNESDFRQTTLIDKALESKINELIELQSKLYDEKEHVEKESLKNQIQDIYNEIVIEQLEYKGSSIDDYYQAIKMPSQPFVLWQLYFPKVFRDNGGFDIVIGNPPWGAKLSKEEKAMLMAKYPEIDSSTPNSFAYFMGLGYKLSVGSMNLVLPDSILIKDYSKTRQLIYDTLSEVIWYQNSGVPVDYRPFKAVDHDVCVIHVKKNKKMEGIHIVTNKWIDKAYIKEEWSFRNDEVMYPQFDYSINLKIQMEDIPILSKLTQHKPISSFVQCHEGIHTGNVRDKLFKSEYDPSYKPLFYGGGAGDIISTYHSKRSNWYVDYRKEIIDKSKKEYASLREESIFSLPKVYITRTGNPFKAFYDVDCYASNNFFSLQMSDLTLNTEENLLLMLPFINSTVCQYFIRVFAAPRLGNTFIETKIIHLLKLPMPNLNEREKSDLLNMVREVIARKEEDIQSDTKELESALNKMVYQCYGLTDTEIEIIERNVSK